MKLSNSCLLLLTVLTVFNRAQGNVVTNMIVNSQQNEPRNIGLESLGIATGSYSTDSGFAQIVQPIQIADNTFVPPVRQYVYTSTIVLQNGVSQKAQLYFQDPTSNTLILSIYNIQTSFNGSTVVSELTQVDVTALVGSQPQSPAVTLYADGQGILLYTAGDAGANSSIQTFTYDATSKKLTFSSVQSLGIPVTQLTSSPLVYGARVFFWTFSKNEIVLFTFAITAPTLTYLDSTFVCKYFKTFSVQFLFNDLGLTLRCYEENTNQEIFEQYINNNVRLVPVISNLLTTSSIGTLQDAKMNGKMLYILESFPGQNPYSMQLTTMRREYKQLSVQTQAFVSPISLTSALRAIISPQFDLITIVSASQVVGISIASSNVLFIFPMTSISTISQTTYSPVLVHQFSNLLIVSFVATNDSTNFLQSSFYSHVPSLNYIQPAASTQIAVNLASSLNKSLLISANALTGIYAPQILTSNLNVYQIMARENSFINISLDDAILGSNIFETVQTFSSSLGGSISAGVYAITNTDFGNYYIPISNILNVYSASYDCFLLQLAPQNNQYQYSYATIEYDPTYNNFFYIVAGPFGSSFSTPIVDSAGSFAFVSNDKWAIYMLYYVTDGYIIATISTNCQSTSSFTFATDPQNVLAAVVCDNALSIYSVYSVTNSIASYYQRQIQFDKTILATTVQSIYLQPNGFLAITDNITVLGFDLNNGIFLGTVTVPQAVKTTDTNAKSKILLFSESFIYATQTTLTQLSYTQFNSQPATVLRTLTQQSFTWTISDDLSNITPSYNLNQEQEYLIVPGTVNTSNVYIIYRLTDVTSLNQLYTSIPRAATQQIVFSSPDYIGLLVVNSVLSLYNFNYRSTLQVSCSIPSALFQSQISFYQSATLSISGSTETVNINLRLQRDVSSAAGQIDSSSTQAQYLQNYFLKNKLASNTEISFQDNTIYSANLFGWSISSIQNNVSVQGAIIQRTNLGLSDNTNGYIDFLTISQDVTIYATQTAISLSNNAVLDTFNTNRRVQFFLDNAQTSIQTKNAVITSSYTVFALVLNATPDNTVILKKYVITTVDTNGVVTISNTVNSEFSLSTSLFNEYSLVSLTTDSVLGLIGLFKDISSNLQSVYNIALDSTNNSFAVNICWEISSLQIVFIEYSSDIQGALFFAQDGNAYYSFNQALTEYQATSLTELFNTANVNVQLSSVLTQAAQLSNGYFLFEFDYSKLFMQSLQVTNGAIKLLQSTGVVYEESAYQFTGVAFLTTLGQLVVVSRQGNSPNNYGFLLYELVGKTGINDYLLKSSAFYELGQMVSTIRGNITDSSIQVMVRQNQLTINKLYQLSINPSVDISIASMNSLPNGFTGAAFGIAPLLVQANSENTLLFSANASGGGDNPEPTSSFRVSAQILLVFIFIILGY